METEKTQKGIGIYFNSPDNKFRYALGTIGEKTLYCFGINPSTATIEKDDPTIRKVKSLAQNAGFDYVVMLNVYPERAACPDNIDENVNLVEHRKNLQTIMSVIKDGSTVWAAWGNLINKKPYLKGIRSRGMRDKRKIW